jgi:hypothetical protein
MTLKILSGRNYSKGKNLAMKLNVKGKSYVVPIQAMKVLG